MASFTSDLRDLDPDVFGAIQGEISRQRETLEMIASENFVPRAVLQAQGSVLTNKYAEGYPGRRYYGGCEHVDVVEDLARNRAKELFGAEFANVQPHSGAQANAAVLSTIAEPGDKILGLSLAHGGHLTHGMKLNFSGKLYDVAAYEVDPETMRVDMDKLREQALKEKPKVIIGGWSAYPRTMDFAAFREIADEVQFSYLILFNETPPYKVPQSFHVAKSFANSFRIKAVETYQNEISRHHRNDVSRLHTVPPVGLEPTLNRF